MDPSHLLSKFVSVTQADPGLAHDLLEGQNWNWDAAMKDFKQLQDIGATPRTTPITSKTNQQMVHSKSSPTSSFSTREEEDPHLLNKPAGNNNGSRSPGATKKLTRGISVANARIVGLTRQEVVDDEQDPTSGHHLVETPVYTFVLPDLDVYHADFRAFIEKDLLEMTTMVSLENAYSKSVSDRKPIRLQVVYYVLSKKEETFFVGLQDSARLNWWADACPKLWPMATTGDGNCLLHAASLGMWGFHDRQLTLRKALYQNLTENVHSPRMQRLKRRWRWHQMQVNKESGLVYSEEEWEEEWRSLLKLASAEPRMVNKNSPPSSGGFSLGTLAEEPESPTSLSPPSVDDDDDPLYESLEEFHVFVLASILQRPIIIVADTVLRDADGEAFAPIPFGGIYLPLDCKYQHCQKSPLVLTYDAAHFSGLVPMERLKTNSSDGEDKSNQQALIPVTDCNHKLLPIHFSIDPGLNWQWNKDENDNSTPNGKLTLSMAQKLVILKRYLNLDIVPIPGLKREISVESSKSENGLQDNQREISRSSSSESEKSDLKNEKDKKTKKKSSFGKKLKCFSGVDKGGQKGGKVGMRASGPSNTQVEKTPQVTTADIEEPSMIVGAKMTEKRHQLHDEMIRNYLERAKTRFDEEHKLLRLLENEAAPRHSRSQGAQQQQQPRMNVVSNVNSQKGYHSERQTDLPADSYHVQKQKAGVPNRYPVQHTGDGGRAATGHPSRGHHADRQPARQQPIRQPQPTVPQSTIFVNRQTNPKHVISNNASSGNTQARHKTTGYPSPNKFPPGMRPVSQGNITSTDGRMPISDSRMSPPKGVSGGHIASSNAKPHANYDITKMQKALPKSEIVEPRPGVSSKSNSDDRKSSAGTKPCRSPDCAFYGTDTTDYYCSKCYQTKAHSSQGKSKKKGGPFWKK